MDPVVAARDVSVRYGDVTAVRRVDLTLQSGEIFGLIGPNGAGKTSIVRALTGTVAVGSGDVSVFGRPPRTAARTRIGLLPQAFSPPTRLTGREIVRYYANLYPDARSVDAVLEAVGMRDSADRWYERLSGGQQRRICVGTALVNDPDLLILDEPTTGIDPAGKRALWELLEALRDDGRTVLMTTHDMHEAQELSDRVGLLADGHLVADGTPTGLIDRYSGAGRISLQPITPVPEELATDFGDRYERSGDTVLIRDTTPSDLPRIIDQLATYDVTYTALGWERPTLSDVYFTLTETSEAEA